MVSDEFKPVFDSWFDKRVRELGNLRNLHYSLIGLKRDEYSEFQGIIDDLIFTYTEIGTALIDGEGKIRSIPREIKSDMVQYLRGRATDYPEAGVLAETIRERVPNASPGGGVSKPWLTRKGKTRADLVWKDNLQQIGKTTQKELKKYKGLELE